MTIKIKKEKGIIRLLRTDGKEAVTMANDTYELMTKK